MVDLDADGFDDGIERRVVTQRDVLELDLSLARPVRRQLHLVCGTEKFSVVNGVNIDCSENVVSVTR